MQLNFFCWSDFAWFAWIPYHSIRYAASRFLKDLQGLELTIVLFSRAKTALCTHNGCVAERHVGRSAMGQSHCLRYAHFGKRSSAGIFPPYSPLMWKAGKRNMGMRRRRFLEFSHRNEGWVCDSFPGVRRLSGGMVRAGVFVRSTVSILALLCHTPARHADWHRGRIERDCGKTPSIKEDLEPKDPTSSFCGTIHARGVLCAKERKNFQNYGAAKELWLFFHSLKAKYWRFSGSVSCAGRWLLPALPARGKARPTRW